MLAQMGSQRSRQARVGVGMPSDRHGAALEAQKEQVAVRGERTTGEGVKFERTRRITGYLSPMHRFNNAKRAEERDRVKHDTNS